MGQLSILLGLPRQHLGAIKKNSGAGKSGSTVPVHAPAFGGGSSLTKELKQKIFERDNHTCQCCGFKSEKYQEVIHVDGNPDNISEANLRTGCIFCHQCFNLDKVSIMRSGVLLWLPEVDQADLHHIARAVYVARISQGAMAEAARKALDVLMTRRDEVCARIGTDDPYILATVMQDYLNKNQYQTRNKKIDGVRLFPLDRRIIKESDLEFNQFPQILAYWRSKNGPFGGKAPQKWFDIYHQLTAAA